MTNIKISIEDKRALVEGSPIIICGNSDYSLQFTFDAEWEAVPYKTARFVYVRAGRVLHEDVDFTGSEVKVPKLFNTLQVKVGVFAGEVYTSTPAVIPCKGSILCGCGEPANPTPEEDARIMALLNLAIEQQAEAEATADRAEAAADRAEAATVQAENTISATTILCKTSGTTILTTDSAKAKPNITTFGKSTQRQYEGTNILPPNIVINGTGLDITVNEDKEFVVSGTTKDEVGIDLYLFGGWTGTKDMGIRGDVTFCCDDENIIIYVSHYDGTSTSLVTHGKGSCSATVTDENYITGVSFRFLQNTKYNKTICFWANDGLEKLPFEPFVGNAPSPSLAYPQEVTPIGEGGSVNEKVFNKNLVYRRQIWDSETKTMNGVDFVVNEDRSITVNGIATDDIQYTVGYVDVFKGFSYKASGCPPTGSEDTYYLGIGWFPRVFSNTPIKTTQSDDHVCFVGIYIKKGVTVSNLIFKPMVWHAEIEDDTYMAGNEQPLTLQTPNGLHGIPLEQTIPDAIKNSPIHMSGVYWDEVEGQYYIGDTKNENGKDVQRVWTGEISYKPSFVETPDRPGRFLSQSSISMQRPTFMNALCPALSNFAVWSSWGALKKGKDVFALNGSHIYFSPGKTMTVDEVNEYFNGKIGSESPLIVSGILADPIITDISAEDQTQYDAVHMNYPNTTIVNDAGAHMEVEYVADTKEHIRQNYVPVSEFREALDRIAALEHNAINS